eukprot:2264213-Amphidinium_carterae.1
MFSFLRISSPATVPKLKPVPLRCPGCGSILRSPKQRCSLRCLHTVLLTLNITLTLTDYITAEVCVCIKSATVTHIGGAC